MRAPPPAARRGAASAAAAAAAAAALLLLLAAATATTANAFLVAPPPRPLSAAGAAAAAIAGRRAAHLWAAPTLLPKQQPSSSRRRRPLWAVGEEDYEGEPPSTELEKLLEEDPKAKSVLAYLSFVSLALLGLGIATFKLGGQLLGLGFADDSNFYWDSAPSYALLVVYPPLLLVFPEARGLLLKTLVLSLAVTAAIWAFPYDAIGWEPTNDHILVTVATPVLGYLTFFCWRATKTYLEIVAEEQEEQEQG